MTSKAWEGRVCVSCGEVHDADDMYYGNHPVEPNEVVWLCLVCLADYRCDMINECYSVGVS